MEVEKPEIGGHQRMLVSILGHFRSFFMLVIGSPLYQHFILVQNCHCMIASLKVADANNIKILKKNYARQLLEGWRPGVRMDF